jgi:diaminohydroxyphosphoribosylaminopyrimidine deaminase/5-amino-6-(5-phosphoribosylamino)uracil reductase
VRVIVDSALRTPETSQLVTTARTQPTWIAHAPDASLDRASSLASHGVTLLPIDRASDGGGLDLTLLLRELARRDVMRVLVEAGGRLAGALLDAELVDRAAIFVAPVIVGDQEAPGLATRVRPPLALASAIRLDRTVASQHGPDMLVRGNLRTLTW